MPGMGRCQPQGLLSAAGQGQAPVDLVFRQALRQEAGRAGQLESASLLWDIKKFYEDLEWSRLVAAAIASTSPSPSTSVA